MKMSRKSLRVTLAAAVAVVALPLLLYGICRGVCEYTYYRDYKSVRSIKLLHVISLTNDRCEMDLPVSFTTREHDAVIRQMTLVKAENKKSFLILRYDDGRIQLSLMPFRRFWRFGWISACYDVTDAEAKNKLEKLLNEHCR